jgi:hypothetical protein
MVSQTNEQALEGAIEKASTGTCFTLYSYLTITRVKK